MQIANKPKFLNIITMSSRPATEFAGLDGKMKMQSPLFKIIENVKMMTAEH